MALALFDEGVWIDSAPARILGMNLTATMTVVRLQTGGLLLHSPLEMTVERRLAVEALGVIEHLYAPNAYHHLWIGEWSTAFPAARTHGPATLSKKRPDVRVDRIFGGTAEPDFSDVIDEYRIRGFRMDECALVHRPSGTLLVADLVHNVGRPRGVWSALYTRVMGFHDRVAISRMIRWTAFADRSAARSSIDELLAAPFDRVIVGHGTPLGHDGKALIAAAFSWLQAGP
jgi:hypothetical protein